MPNEDTIDLASLRLGAVIFGADEIRRRNAQRFEMEMLDAVIHCDVEAGIIAGFKDLRRDDWWARGHIPGDPLFPGCLMVEAAAQLASFFYREALGDRGAPFFGFGGIDDLRFRGAVRPPARFIVAARRELLRPRMSRFLVQGFVDGRLVFGGKILGVALGRSDAGAAEG